MNEVISSILEAENKADEIVALSLEKAKKIKAEGEQVAENIKNSAIARAKLRRATTTKEANDNAEKEYQKTIEEGVLAAKEIYESSKVKIKEISEELLNGLLQ